MFEIEHNLIMKYTLPDICNDILSARDYLIYEIFQEELTSLEDLPNHELVCIAQALALKYLYKETVNSFPQETAQIYERLSQSDKFRDGNIQDRIHRLLQEQDSRKGTHHGQRSIDTNVQIHDKS